MIHVGLVAEDVVFSDAVVECTGVAAWLEYAQVRNMSTHKAREFDTHPCNVFSHPRRRCVTTFEAAITAHCMVQRVEDAGGSLEIRNIWGNMSPRRCPLMLP